MKQSYSPLQSFWLRHLGLLSLFATVFVAALGFALDVLLLREGVPRADRMLVSSSIAGVIAGLFFYQFLRNERNKQEAVHHSMRTIAELNHHIRNALQVIRYAGGSRSSLDASQLQLINEAVARIDWALREVLPKYPLGSSPRRKHDLPENSMHPAFSSAVVEDFVLRHREQHPR